MYPAANSFLLQLPRQVLAAVDREVRTNRLQRLLRVFWKCPL
jgi:hypothetical protein